MNGARLKRLAALCVVGGIVFQTAGCAASLTPILFSLAENVLLSLLFGGGGFLL